MCCLALILMIVLAVIIGAVFLFLKKWTAINIVQK
jgi:hypothetical protein